LKKILIIGGTGFLGYHLAKYCLKKKFKVTSVSKNTPKLFRFLNKVHYIKCDISKKKLLEKKLNTNFDYVVNFGGYVDHTNKQKTFKSHYLGAKILGNLFINKKIKKYIQIGSSMEYGRVSSPQKEDYKCEPESTYGISKFMATQYFLNLNIQNNFPVTILRLYQVYGPYQDLNRLIPIVINSCKDNKNFPCSNGKQLRDFLYVDDLIRAIFITLNKKEACGKIINIGSGYPIKIKKIIKKIRKHFEKGNPLFGRIKLRKEELLKIYPDLKNAKNILNWKPRVDFNTGIKKTINFYQRNNIEQF
jgi:dTDP-glucose 4,6-dehydratase